MHYKFEEAKAASVEYFSGDDLAADVFVGKYALRDNEKNILEKTPHDMHKRICDELIRIERSYPNPLDYDHVMDMLTSWTIVPQGSPMSAIGNPYRFQSLSNCFVIESPYDSYGGIMHTDEEQAQLMKRRGGVGYDISTIRPKGLSTTNAAVTTDGIGVFMNRYSNTCREVAQGGRRGALMLSLSCFAGSTPILTEDGWMTIRSMVESSYSGKAWTHDGFKEIDAYQSMGERDVYEIECENGRTITVTADHEFVVKNVISGNEYLKKICDVDPTCEELVFYDVQFEARQ